MKDSAAHERLEKLNERIDTLHSRIASAKAALEERIAKLEMDTNRRLALIMEHLGVEIVNEPEHWTVKKKK